MKARINVLILMGTAYLTLIIVFCCVVFLGEKTTPAEAYEVVNGPFMALVGGTVAIAKDLINTGPNE